MLKLRCVTLRLLSPRPDHGRGRRRVGFVLVAFSLALLLILGTVGLAFDVGRMYITRNELQSFCDAAAIAAVAKLNGTTPGLDAARNAAQATIKGFQFGTTPIDSAHATIKIEFAQNPETPTSPINWELNPAPAGIVLARVTASASLPMSIMPVVTRVFDASIAASASAKQVPTGKLTNIFPFTPYWMPDGFTLLPVIDIVNKAESAVPADPKDPYGMVPARLGNDPAYTYQQGGIYSLRGPSNIDLKKPLYDPTDPTNPQNQMCRNDATGAAAAYRNVDGNSARGYISWSQGKNDITQTILGNNVSPDGLSIGVGDSVVSSCDFCLVDGTATVEVFAIRDRIGMDTPQGQAAYNYREYMQNANGGNGARVVVVPISTGLCGGAGQPICPQYPPDSGLTGTAGPNSVLGFAAYFLLKADWYQPNGAQPICAEYIGPWTPNQAGAGNPGQVTLPLLVQ